MAEKVTIRLNREPEQNDVAGTLGILHLEDIDPKLHWIKTLELDWRNNEKNVSCIPEGEYKLKPRSFGKYFNAYKKRWEHKHAIEVEDVSGRDAILIHTGNTTDHTKGCVLVGKYSFIMDNAHRLNNSRDAYVSLYDALDFDKHDYYLKISDTRPEVLDEPEFSTEERNEGDL